MEECKHIYSNGKPYYREGLTYIDEDLNASVLGNELVVELGGEDYYAQYDRIPIKFCPFCGKNVKDIEEEE